VCVCVRVSDAIFFLFDTTFSDSRNKPVHSLVVVECVCVHECVCVCPCACVVCVCVCVCCVCVRVCVVCVCVEGVSSP